MNARTATLRTLAIFLAGGVLCALCGAARSEDRTYDARYTAALDPRAQSIHVTIELSGEKLPSQLTFKTDAQQHRAFRATDPLERDGDRLTWRPQGRRSRLSYDYIVNHERANGRFDSLITEDWAIFRGDRMVPRVAVRAVKHLKARSTLTFALPDGWSAATAFGPSSQRTLEIDDPQRRFDRPQGWMIVGRIGTRSEKIGDIQATVAAPIGDSTRRQDILAFLRWNLPRIVEVFPDFSKRLLVVTAGDPMWRGGLSGPHSLFLHADRPLISENRTSTLLHELIHVAMRISADSQSDWIVEGLAEYYSLEILRRAGGIGPYRHREALRNLHEWAARAPTLFTPVASGAVTARAVLVFQRADAEIRAATAGKASLDDVARRLASYSDPVSLEDLQKTAEHIAGQPLQSLQRERLNARIAAPAR